MKQLSNLLSFQSPCGQSSINFSFCGQLSIVCGLLESSNLLSFIFCLTSNILLLLWSVVYCLWSSSIVFLVLQSFIFYLTSNILLPCGPSSMVCGPPFYLISLNTFASAFLPIKVARSPAVTKLP